MTGDVTDRELMLAQQGKRVLVSKSDGSRSWLLTIVHAVNGDHHELRLVNREKRERKPDWPLSQRMWEAVEPSEPSESSEQVVPKRDYEVTIK